MSELPPCQRALQEAFTKVCGYWSPLWDQVLALDPDFFEVHLKFSVVPWRQGVQEPKVHEFIYIATDASTTHLHAACSRTHMRNALRHVVTRQEIMEVLELTSVLSIHNTTHGVPVLVEDLQAVNKS